MNAAAAVHHRNKKCLKRWWFVTILSLLETTTTTATTGTTTITRSDFISISTSPSVKTRPLAFTPPHTNPITSTSKQPKKTHLHSSSSSSKTKKNNLPLSKILQNTSIDPTRSDVNLIQVYQATTDGWSAIDFHKCCDGRGSSLVVVKIRKGFFFGGDTYLGGFNPLGWLSTDDYNSSNSAFLWFLNPKKEVIKCPILKGGNAAIFDYATGGPCFGSADLMIGPPRAAVMGGFTGPDMEDMSLNAGDLRQGRSNVGGAYERVKGWPVGGADFGGGIVDVVVYANGNVKQMVSGGGGGGGGASWWPF